MEFPKRLQRTYVDISIERPNTKPGFMNDKGGKECAICSFKVPANYLTNQKGLLVCMRCADSK